MIMIEISVYLSLDDYAKKVCKLRERIAFSGVSVPVDSIYSVFKYLYSKSVIEIVLA